MRRRAFGSALAVALCFAAALVAQDKGDTGIIKVNVSRSIKSIAYKPGTSTRIDFRGTPLHPYAVGEANVKNQSGSTTIDAKFSKLNFPSTFGPEFLTYVLWAITPEGRANNLGELVLSGGNAKMKVTTRLQAFGLVVTAEPYFAVSIPSETVVLENIVRSDTVGKVEMVDAKTELLQRGRYADAKLTTMRVNPKAPPEYAQALNAKRIALWQKTDKYASDSWAKAENALAQAEDYLNRKQNRKTIAMASRTAVQAFEDARLISLKRQDEERQAREKQAAAAKAKAEAEAKAAEEARRQAELTAEREARMKAEAELKAAQAKAEADRKEAAARAEAERQRQAAERARLEAERAEKEKQALRAMLLDQLNRVLETRDTPRGLVVNMADVLFDLNKYNLRMEAREKLAKLSGIVLAHPGLKLEVEGHTDSTGSDEHNMELSQKRADAVRDYLEGQGLDPATLTSRGFGKDMPVADNATAEGRQKNRRVEIIVSGEVIGTRIGH
ncbi:MAG: OmpA family protein [Acidobacteria bacterium]|nr:OmpA family protein [Acidobacteriota bacterium]